MYIGHRTWIGSFEISHFILALAVWRATKFNSIGGIKASDLNMNATKDTMLDQAFPEIGAEHLIIYRGLPH
jgi:hypothetical protein